MHKLSIVLAGLTEVTALRTGQPLRTTSLFDTAPPCATYPCAATSIVTPSSLVQVASAFNRRSSGNEGQVEVVQRVDGDSDDEGGERNALVVRGQREPLYEQHDGEVRIVLNTANLRDRMALAARNTFTIDNFKAMWGHRHRPMVLMCFGGYYAFSWVSYAMSMFGIWSAVGALPPALVIGGGVLGGAYGAHYYMNNQDWFEQQIEAWRQHAPAVVSTLQGLGVLQVCIFVWTAMLQTLFYGVAIGGAVIGWRYFKGTEEERAAMLANVNAGQERIQNALENPEELRAPVQEGAASFFGFMLGGGAQPPARRLEDRGGDDNI